MNEKYRPQIHFSPKNSWMNDPNGLIYHEGTYHLFFQYYPEDIVWGPMHWGHATSKNLVRWEEQSIALYPDSLGYIFSGSAVMDWKNTSGLGTPDNPPMVAIFTYHDPKGEKEKTSDFQTQGIAYSLDKGVNWKKYHKNPVLKNPGIPDFRDPKVTWIPKYEKWIMALAVKDHISFYSSDNLINWDFESDFEVAFSKEQGVWECPDLFPLTDSEGNEKWVLLVSVNTKGLQGGSATQYFLGDFDGQKFVPDDVSLRWLDQGADNYAGVTFSDIPKADGRRILIGWMSNWQYAQKVPTERWRSAMTLARSLHLFKDQNGSYQLQSKPVEELSALHSEEGMKAFSNQIKTKSDTYKITFKNIKQESLHCTIKNSLGEYCEVTLENNTLRFDRRQSGVTDFEESFASVHTFSYEDISLHQLDIYVDRSSIEIFLNGGQKVMTEIVFPQEPYQIVDVKTTDVKASITPLYSIWKTESVAANK